MILNTLFCLQTAKMGPYGRKYSYSMASLEVRLANCKKRLINFSAINTNNDFLFFVLNPWYKLPRITSLGVMQVWIK